MRKRKVPIHFKLVAETRQYLTLCCILSGKTYLRVKFLGFFLTLLNLKSMENNKANMSNVMLWGYVLSCSNIITTFMLS
jgi:hypothetical protein